MYTCYHFQLIKLYSRQIKRPQLLLPISHSCVCAQPFLALFCGNYSSFLYHPEVKVRNSVSGGRAQSLHSAWLSLCSKDHELLTKYPLSPSFLVTESKYFSYTHCCLAREMIYQPLLQLSKVKWLNWPMRCKRKCCMSFWERKDYLLAGMGSCYLELRQLFWVLNWLWEWKLCV